MSAMEQFEQLEGELAGARERLRAASARRGDRVTALEAAEAALHEHVAAVHAGEREPDPDAEDRLHAAAREAGDVVSVRLLDYPGSPQLKLVDLKAEAEVAGAERAVEAAEAALREFAARHVNELAAELAAGPSAKVGAQAAGALAAAFRALAAWNLVYTRWTEVLRAAERVDLLKTAPVNPFAGMQPPPGDVERGPTPRSLL